MASETRDGDKRGAAGKANEDGKRERPDPPVGTDGPPADSKETVPIADLNSADDE